METKYLKINPADNVVVAISDLKADYGTRRFQNQNHRAAH